MFPESRRGKPQRMTNTREERTVVAEEGPPASTRRQSRIRRDAAGPPPHRAAGAGATALALAAGLARLVRMAAGVVAAIIVAGVLLVVFDANPANDVVSTVHDAARALVGPFDRMFTLDSGKATVAVNWGIAALVYLVLGALIARVVVAVAAAGARRRAIPA